MDMTELGRQVLASQPFSVKLGAELLRLEDGEAELKLPLTRDLLQQHGYAHGGVVSYLADNALTFAGGSALGPDVLTAEFKINYMKGARGEALLARAHTLNSGRRMAVVQCTVYAIQNSGEEVPCAVAQGTIVTRT
ncbi:MAG: PaaI family thioesterase [Gammaproteobacteria bacterium]|nr:MAG: PaaI family thioesterase [Gammaproteobacteria bacterium]